MGIWPFGKQEFKVIRVQFVDVAGVATFNPVDLPVERLPESFEAETTMHLRADDWRVEEARPVTAAEFRQTGKLVLLVRKLKMATLLSTDNILFSLPTISNELPALAEGSSKLGKNVLEMHEDDWRQVEWVSGTQMEAIDRELAGVMEIYEHQRVSSGFKKVHAREGIPMPLGGAEVGLEELMAAAGARATVLDGVSLSGVAGVGAETFGVRMMSSIEIYGQVRDGRVKVAGFGNRRANNMPGEDVRSLAEFAERQGLVLVDWCRVMKVEAEERAYREYFAGDEG